MSMATIAGNCHSALLAVLISTVLSGCGLTQKMADGTVAVTKSIFYKQVTTLHLDFNAREAVNNNAKGAALSTIVRIYQLRDRKIFDSTDYSSLFAEDSTAIKVDLLVQRDIRMLPGGSISVDMPLEEGAQYVAIAGMFVTPDEADDTWRVVLKRDELDPDKARRIELNAQSLTLSKEKE